MGGLAERVEAVEQRVQSMDADVKGHLLEQFSMLSGEIRAVDGKVTALAGTFDRFERDVKAAFAGLDARLHGLDERLNGIDAKLSLIVRRTAPKPPTRSGRRRKR